MKEHIVVIGGGGTGAAVLYDLALRGYPVTLFEKGELTSGTTGRHHGQLHCGARYALHDRHIAAECMTESAILRNIARDTIEFNYGMFAAVQDEDMQYVEEFISACQDAGIPARRISPAEALRMEPGIHPAIQAAVLVPDGTFDPWRLCLKFFGAAKALGANIHPFTEVVGIDTKNGSIQGVQVLDYSTGQESYCKADIIVNAGGPWGGTIAKMAGAQMEVSPSPGSLVAVQGRLTNMIISRLHPAGDGDIIVPQRNLTIIGSTQWLAEDPDHIIIPPDDKAKLLSYAEMLVPGFSSYPLQAHWAASRPLFGKADGNNSVRSLSRDFLAINHRIRDGITGFFSVNGGKATTLRGMGEALADLVCAELGDSTPCRTRDLPLPGYRSFYRGGV